jgi:hypothetical protein
LSAIANTDFSPVEKLKRMITARVLMRFDSVQHYTQNLNDLLADLRPKLLARRKKYFVEEAAIFVKVIEQGQKGENFKAGDAAEIVETILLATNSLLPFSLTTRELGERSEIEEKTTRLANLLIGGLAKT